MKFRITHHTEYQYHDPASDSFAELRICPQDSPAQKVIDRGLEIDPRVPTDNYTDYFGNQVEFFSIPFRHRHLTVSAWTQVETFPLPKPSIPLHVPVGEARQIYNSWHREIFDFLQPSYHVPFFDEIRNLRGRFCRSRQTLEEALLEINHWIYTKFTYRSGATTIKTTLPEVLRRRTGVCQDFSHLMLALLRLNQIPARYVSGYIESHDPTVTDPALVGAAASHAWVEVFLPGGTWYGLDPTNDQVAGERHVRVAVGRDYRDVAPLRGTFKGAHRHVLQVIVSVERQQTETPSNELSR